jgi:hypothetical protein
VQRPYALANLRTVCVGLVPENPEINEYIILVEKALKRQKFDRPGRQKHDIKRRIL